MDERTIKRAAFEAVSDLELDCEIKDVCRSPDGDQWCVQFSGSYSQFCDEFQDQFERDNSAEVVREKIKRHLIKQVDKIRRSAGKARRAKTSKSADSNIITSPLKVLGDVVSRASGIAGDVIEQAATVADAARETLSSMTENISPVTVEIKSSSSTKARKQRALATRTTLKKSRKASHSIGKKRTKAGKPAAKARKRAVKASAKKKRGRKTKR